VIIATPTSAALAAKAATLTIPILFQTGLANQVPAYHKPEDRRSLNLQISRELLLVADDVIEYGR
jgi:hypothetical protein